MVQELAGVGLQEKARQDFVRSLRAFVLADLAEDMRRAYDMRIARTLKDGPVSGSVVHRAMIGDIAFQFYSSVRVATQRMVWDCVRPSIERGGAGYDGSASAGPGSLTLDPALQMPANVSAIDVHLMPAGYIGNGDPSDLKTGAIYDKGMDVFSFGLLGDDLDEIGSAFARYVRLRFPDLQPHSILDLGCTIGHNTLPWARQFPDARVEAIDVAGPMLGYAHSRAQAKQVPVHFRQMDATALAYPDASFDIVFSSMFLHELPLKATASALREAYRVLKPGGLMLHMELPPNAQVEPYESFYLDWDCYYNAEPFYKSYRDQNPADLCATAGFAPDAYIEFAIPSLSASGADAFDIAVLSGGCEIGNGRTGHFAEGIQWFGFGARKG